MSTSAALLHQVSIRTLRATANTEQEIAANMIAHVARGWAVYPLSWPQAARIGNGEPRATTDPDRIRRRRCLDGGAGHRRVGVWACGPRRCRPLLRAGLSARRAVTSVVCGPGRWPAGW